jgi:UDP-glucose 4-epimerase
MFTEDMEPRRAPRSGYAKDVAEIEGYVRGFARRRPDVRVTMLRAANVVGPHVASPMTSYFKLPVIPTVLASRTCSRCSRTRSPRRSPARSTSPVTGS